MFEATGRCRDTLQAEDVYEKWLRRRMNYAAIRETGNLAAPGLVHTILHSGDSHNAVASEVRWELWRNNKYPSSNYFQHSQVLYGYPDYLQQILDLRFYNTLTQMRSNSISPAEKSKPYNLSFKELLTVPNWLGPLIINQCPHPHSLERPQTWTLGEDPGPSGIQPCPNPARFNSPMYPECCYGKDNICSAVYCQQPLPEAVYMPGPWGRGEAHFKWHLNHPEGKGLGSQLKGTPKSLVKDKQPVAASKSSKPCGC